MNVFTAWLEDNALWLLLALGTMFTAAWLFTLRKRLKIPWYAIVIVALLHTLYGVFAVTSFAFMETGFDTDKLGAMSLFGSILLMPLAYTLGAKLAKLPPGEVFDIFTPCMIFTLMCARVNCIISGCCMGRYVPLFGGVRLPTREAELVFYIILLLLLCPRVQKGSTKGRVFPLYMIGYGAFRFITEFFRDAETTSLFHIAHLWALLTLIMGISIYAEINNKLKMKKGDKR